MDIDGWLRGIGLEQYAQTFRDNAIDADVLCDLTDEHLRELGLPLGARLKLLRAVAALSTGQTPVSPEITTAAPRTDAERRQVTVMFSDLVGSTALSARMDPEDLREVISAYQKCVAETVQRFGGFVAKYMGDGVLVYFGYPHAHEDDAERAVRAGLGLVAAVTSLKTQASLQTRVGIATGLVVVGDLIGSGASQEQAIVGETPNLAARLQGVAEPNAVVIAESTRRLVGSRKHRTRLARALGVIDAYLRRPEGLVYAPVGAIGEHAGDLVALAFTIGAGERDLVLDRALILAVAGIAGVNEGERHCGVILDGRIR